MSNYQYLTGTNHAETLAAALDVFCRALTRRWRDEVSHAIVLGDPAFPRSISRGVAVNPFIAAVQRLVPGVGRGEQLRWDPWSEPAREHVELADGCEFVRWVNDGQDGEVSAVSCHGSTHPEERRDEVGTYIPDRIECGMGSILEQVADWAFAERQHVFSQLPLFDRHDLTALEAAHGALIRLGGELTLDAAPGSEDGFDGTFKDVDEREITTTVQSIADRNAVSNDWLAGWTGLAASRFKAGFAASVIPTLKNQSLIVGALANLYAARAAIIEKGRRDALYWIESATVSLDQTETVSVDHTNFWVAVEGIGMATGLIFAGTGAGAVVGAGIALAGFVGQYLDPGSTTEAYANDMVEVVRRLNDEIDKLNREIGSLEIGYSSNVDNLRETIHGVHSYNLELYDLTQNKPEGDHDEPTGDRSEDEDGDVGRDDDTFSAEIEFVLELAAACYKAGELCGGLLPIIAETRQADRHLTDRDGRPALADRRLIEVRDQLEEYLTTTCARYLVAAKQVRDAAEAYVEVDTEQRDDLRSLMSDWAREEVGEFDPGFDPEQYAGPTDRPWTWAPDQEVPGEGGSSEPGPAAEEDYVTESDER